jgi:Tripartite tricarboxylate transporter family receptor
LQPLSRAPSPAHRRPIPFHNFRLGFVQRVSIAGRLGRRVDPLKAYQRPSAEAGTPTRRVPPAHPEQREFDAFERLVIDNRPGAGGNVGTAIAAKAAPDDYTLLGASLG